MLSDKDSRMVCVVRDDCYLVKAFLKQVLRSKHQH